MKNIKITVEYDGTNLNGWQMQKAGERTVQGELEIALTKIFGKRIIVTGSGRTDSGVHARGQVANFKLETAMAPRDILRALNAHLPKDIAVQQAQEVPLDFHAQFSAKRKTYRYTIINRPSRPVLERSTALHIPHKLNVARMRAEAKHLVGTHDFRSFMAADPALPKGKSKDTVRTIRRITISKRTDIITIDIEATGFLYKMVRNIIGTLLEAGAGRLPTGGMKGILKSRDRGQAGDTVRPHGLCLQEVRYGTADRARKPIKFIDKQT